MAFIYKEAGFEFGRFFCRGVVGVRYKAGGAILAYKIDKFMFKNRESID